MKNPWGYMCQELMLELKKKEEVSVDLSLE